LKGVLGEKAIKKNVLGSSFEELASQGPVREGQKPKSNGFFGLQ